MFTLALMESVSSGNLWNLEIAAPVVGELGGLIPRVNPTLLTSTNVANDPIEKELRLPVSMVLTSIHFCHHKSAKCQLGVDDEPLESGVGRFLLQVWEELKSGDQLELGWVWLGLPLSTHKGKKCSPALGAVGSVSLRDGVNKSEGVVVLLGCPSMTTRSP